MKEKGPTVAQMMNKNFRALDIKKSEPQTGKEQTKKALIGRIVTYIEVVDLIERNPNNVIYIDDEGRHITDNTNIEVFEYDEDKLEQFKKVAKQLREIYESLEVVE